MAASNGNKNGNGGIGWKAKTATKSVQLLMADVVGNVAELVFLRYEKAMNKAFPLVKDVFKSALYYPIKSFQKPLEKMLDHAGNFEDQELHDKRMSKTAEERLDGLLDSTYDYAAAGVVGVATLFATERALSKVMKTEHLPLWPWIVDGIVHTGIVIYMGAPSMKPTTEKVRTTIEKVMVSAGWNEEKAKQDAGFATIYIVPNYMNWISNTALSGAMYAAEANKMWKPTEGLFKNLRELGEKMGMFGGGMARAGSYSGSTHYSTSA
jgi:hypothetical protein